jgi:hypothetical protein
MGTSHMGTSHMGTSAAPRKAVENRGSGGFSAAAESAFTVGSELVIDGVA